MKQTIAIPCVTCKASPGQLCPQMMNPDGTRDYTKTFHYARVLDAITVDMNESQGVPSEPR